MSERLVDIVHTATTATVTEARALVSRPFVPTRSDGRRTLVGLVLQAPLTHADRTRLLEGLAAEVPETTASQLLATADALRRLPPRFPEPHDVLRLPALSAPLTEAFEMLFALDTEVPAPWTLIGGLMVMSHRVQHDVAPGRVTEDADVAVGVFTHRQALARVTGSLRQHRFRDTTPDRLAGGAPLSYRWSRGEVRVDLAVPPKANGQRRVPWAITRRAAVELPAVQQALARSERLTVRLADGTEGCIRRPNLLGAVVIKAEAATSDTREPDRHREDLVALADLLAISGLHLSYRAELRAKDARRVRRAMATIRPAQWRMASAPDAASAALKSLLGATT
ncbi:hypothetical protein AGMMS50218_04970 [Actinomycetota bacterium]|nr:hypothetical protein AGMMS50218_04970 [Actinomycetota bacterium]